MSEAALTPEQWCDRFWVQIIVPSGWDMKNFDEDWARPLTKFQFISRLNRSRSSCRVGWKEALNGIQP